MRSKSTRRYTLSEAAQLVGVAPITLKRWLLSGRVAEVARDRNGWRVFSDNDVQRIKRFANSISPPQAL
jgi:DNA (cytosine-5)-methyltransferase 1